MFGFLKPKRAPEGPFELTGSVEIDCGVEDVYPLIDLADPRHAKRQLGERVEPIAGRPGAWRMVIGAVPDLEFELVETERVPNASIGFDCWINPRVGHLDTSHELYRLEALGDNACRLVLVNTVSFSKRLRRAELEHEAIKLTLSIHNALAKLKIQAEQGIEAARAADEEIVVGLECAVATGH